MKAHTIGISALFAIGLLAGGCANDGTGLMSTSSVAADKVAMAPKVDPACVSLTSQIDTLRKEGAVESLEKAASGKSASVKVMRTALAKQAELNKANADFQAKCGPAMPKAQSAMVAPPAPIPASTTAAAATATGAAAPQAKAAATTAATPAVQAAAKN